MSYIVTKNVGENYLNPIIKYIMLSLENDREHLHKRGDRIQDILWNKSSVLLYYIDSIIQHNQFEMFV